MTGVAFRWPGHLDCVCCSDEGHGDALVYHLIIYFQVGHCVASLGCGSFREFFLHACHSHCHPSLCHRGSSTDEPSVDTLDCLSNVLEEVPSNLHFRRDHAFVGELTCGLSCVDGEDVRGILFLLHPLFYLSV